MGLLDWFQGRARAQGPFRMPVDGVFALKTPGKVVVVGVVADGEVRRGDRLVLRAGEASVPVAVEALEAHHKPVQSARRGDQVGVLLAGVDKAQVGDNAVLLSAEPADAAP
jgi:selenocysteine-specific translation elongation factor